MRLAGYVARTGRGEAYTGFSWGYLRERDHLGEPGLDGRVILRWIFREVGFGVWIGSSWLGIGTCEFCNEPSGSIKCGKFLG